MASLQTLEVPIQGMDCAECTMHVRQAIAALPGVQSVDVLLVSEKAVIQLDPALVDLPSIRKAVQAAGYEAALEQAEQTDAKSIKSFTRPVLTLLGIVFGVVLFVVIVGEWLGLFEAVTDLVPLWVGVAIVLAAGYPVFRKVVQATLRGQVIAHTLMTLGVIAALVVGEWVTAVVVVFFMRVGDYVEHFTTERARRAVKDLTTLAPQTARIEIDGAEVVIPAAQAQPGDPPCAERPPWWRRTSRRAAGRSAASTPGRRATAAGRNRRPGPRRLILPCSRHTPSRCGSPRRACRGRAGK